MPLQPRVRILSTGSELLHGLYPDTNAQKIARFLFPRGMHVTGIAAAPDDPTEIFAALEHPCQRCELLVMTGGLGPTEDDVNRDVIATLWNLELKEDARARSMLEERFAHRGVPMPRRNLVQTMLPEGCVPLYNHWGTAPGFIIPPTAGLPVLVALPGPSREWEPMLEKAWEEYLAPYFPVPNAQELRTIHLANVPESTINELLADLFNGGDTHGLTLLASTGHIRIRMIGKGSTDREAAANLDALEREVLQRIPIEGAFAHGPENISLPEVTIEELGGAGETIALAESCTGGMVAAALTDVAGSSAVFKGGWVTYSNEAKVNELGVDGDLIDRHGAVSGEVAAAMAVGARQRSGATWAVSVTGIAGPGGGSGEKPVGLVWFAVAGAKGVTTLRRQFPGDRGFVRALSVMQALEFLRRVRHDVNPEPLIPGMGETAP